MHCPVKMLHGGSDADVSWAMLLHFVSKLASNDVSLALIKNADHRLSDQHALSQLSGALDELDLCYWKSASRLDLALQQLPPAAQARAADSG